MIACNFGHFVILLVMLMLVLVSEVVFWEFMYVVDHVDVVHVVEWRCVW